MLRRLAQVLYIHIMARVASEGRNTLFYCKVPKKPISLSFSFVYTTRLTPCHLYLYWTVYEWRPSTTCPELRPLPQQASSTHRRFVTSVSTMLHIRTILSCRSFKMYFYTICQ